MRGCVIAKKNDISKGGVQVQTRFSPTAQASYRHGAALARGTPVPRSISTAPNGKGERSKRNAQRCGHSWSPAGGRQPRASKGGGHRSELSIQASGHQVYLSASTHRNTRPPPSIYQHHLHDGISPSLAPALRCTNTSFVPPAPPFPLGPYPHTPTSPTRTPVHPYTPTL